MKTLIFTALFFVVSSNGGLAQCGKKTILLSSQTEYLDATGTVQRVDQEKSIVEINSADITIIPGDEQRRMTGKIKSDTCSWKIPFKEGKTIIKALFVREGGQETMNATVTIEGKDGKINLLFEVEERPDRKIRIVADKFEEKI
jgi:Cu/Ag efflux protein CusF